MENNLIDILCEISLPFDKSEIIDMVLEGKINTDKELYKTINRTCKKKGLQPLIESSDPDIEFDFDEDYENINEAHVHEYIIDNIKIGDPYNLIYPKSGDNDFFYKFLIEIFNKVKDSFQTTIKLDINNRILSTDISIEDDIIFFNYIYGETVESNKEIDSKIINLVGNATCYKEKEFAHSDKTFSIYDFDFKLAREIIEKNPIHYFNIIPERFLTDNLKEQFPYLGYEYDFFDTMNENCV